MVGLLMGRSGVILGIDPGLANTGWGVVRRAHGAYSCVAYGCISTTNSKPTSLRLLHIYRELVSVIRRFEPSSFGIEQIYFGTNAKSAFATGQARGAALLACAEADLAVGEYTPMQIKQAVVGTGTADKEQVQYMVRALLGLDHSPKPDHAADALAAAICHGNLEGSLRGICNDHGHEPVNLSWDGYVKQLEEGSRSAFGRRDALRRAN